MKFISQSITFLKILNASKCSKTIELLNKVLSSLKLSRATFYRILDKLKNLGLIVWEKGKVSITDKGKEFLSVFIELNKEDDEGLNYGPINNIEDEQIDKETKEIKENIEYNQNTVYENRKIEEKEHNYLFVLHYPTATPLLNKLLEHFGEDKKGTNADKLKKLTEKDLRGLRIAVLNFENANKQTIIFLDYLIKSGLSVDIGFKNKKYLYQNEHIKKFLKENNFKNFDLEGLEMDDSVNLFPILVLFLVVGVALTISDYFIWLIPIYLFRRWIYNEIK
jgi:DNA-binding PadR family transcriptional regulator